MDKLNNIKKFDEYYSLNESLLYGEQKDCNRAFIHGGPITFQYQDGTTATVRPEEIVRVVNEALTYLQSQYTKTFEFATKTLNIIYLAHSSKYKTMAVDKSMNLYLNAGFVYNVLKMDSKLIAAVIMHEVFHALYKHIPRGENWLSANGKPTNEKNWHDTNLAADIEVNQTLVRINLISEERLINEIKGLYLKNANGIRGGSTNVVTMETILNDEEYMNKLRQMCPPPDDPETKKKNTIKTTEAWEKGYKDAWNKIAGLIKKHGYKKVWEKLQEAGLINSVGEIFKDKEIEDIKNLEFLQVKSLDEFINENLDIPKSDKGQTYDDGFVTAFGKLVEKLNNAMNPQPGGDGGSGGQGGDDYYDTELKDEDLDEIDIPNPSGESGEGEDDGLPDNTKSDSNDNGEGGDDQDDNENPGGDPGGEPEKSKSGQKSKSAGKGGKGKSSDQLTDDDINKLADDISKRTGGGSDKISTKQDVEMGEKGGSSSDQNSIGNTGSFSPDGPTDDDLREAGYSDEDIETINKVRKANEEKNTPEKMEKIIDDVRRNIPKGNYIGKMLDNIEIESEKYKNVWKKILDQFLAKNTRRAGNDSPTGANDWIRKKSIARGEYGIHRQKEAKEPQDINLYIDVSGSVDLELLEIISKSLVVMAKTWKYSTINICPWASYSNGVHKVDEFYRRSEEEVSKEILETISAGIAQCGGGTDAKAFMAAMELVCETLDDKVKKKKDDVHIIITDGWFDHSNIEHKISQVLKDHLDRDDVAMRVPENTFWMIYDMTSDEDKNDWKREIKKGTLIFINSNVVKNNK